MRRLHAARPWSWGFAALATAFAVWAWQEAPDAQAVPAAPSPAMASPALERAAWAGPEQPPGAGHPAPAGAAHHADEAWDALAAIRQASSYADVIERLQRRRAPGDLQLATQLAQFCQQAQGWRLASRAGAEQRAAWQAAQGRCASLGPQPANTLATLRAQRQATPDGWMGWQAAWEQGGTHARREMLSRLKDPRFLLDALLDPRTRWSAGGWSQDAHNRLTLSDSALQWSLCQSQDSCQAGLGPEALQRCIEDGLCASTDHAFWQAAVAREEAALPMAAQQQARGQREALARVIRQGSWQELDWQPAPAAQWVKAQTQG